MKAKLKEKKKEVVGVIPDGMQAKDLSVEKRIELYQEVVKKFDAEMSQIYGLSIGVELNISTKGIFPKMVLVDLLANKNEGKKTNEEAKPATQS